MKSLHINLLVVLFLFSSFIPKSNIEYEYIEFADLTFKPIIAVTLNGKKAYFLLDSGSDITLIDHNVSEKYGFKTIHQPNEKHTVLGVIGQTAEVMSIQDINLQIGSSRVFNRYLAFNLKALVAVTFKNTGFRISGIIGSDLMKRYGFVIDYANKRVGIQKSSDAKQKKAEDTIAMAKQ